MKERKKLKYSWRCEKHKDPQESHSGRLERSCKPSALLTSVRIRPLAPNEGLSSSNATESASLRWRYWLTVIKFMWD